MTALRFTLLSEGSSDRALLPVLIWALRQHSDRAFQPLWADLRSLHKPPRTLSERVQATVELYPCDLLFIHRDADRAGWRNRREEISAALQHVPEQTAVCVIPVRAQETWFLFSEAALRTAAGNPTGTVPLPLPRLSRLEQLKEPKGKLFDLVNMASELSPRRLRRLSLPRTVHRIAEIIDDYAPLRALPAFQAFETELRETLTTRSWI